MKKYLFLLIPILAGCQSPYAFDRQLTGHRLPNHYVGNACDDFSRDLNVALFTNHIDSIKLVYDWTCHQSIGRHCIVAFVKDGKIWGMDNCRHNPKEIKGKTDLELCQSFCRWTKIMVDSDTDKWTNPRPLSEMFTGESIKSLIP